MIYWGYVNQPKPAPEPVAASVPDEEKEYRIDWEMVGDTLITIGAGLFFYFAASGMVIWVISWAVCSCA